MGHCARIAGSPPSRHAGDPRVDALELELATGYNTDGWVGGIANLQSESTMRAGLAWRFGHDQQTEGIR